MANNKTASYGSQLQMLKRPLTWISIIVSLLFNAGIFGVYSYLTDFLNNVTGATHYITSIALFIYGAANIIGNILSGKLLTTIPQKLYLAYPLH